MSSESRLQPEEEEIDVSPVSYFPPGGDKCKGTLTVTNRRLIYEGTFNAGLQHVTDPAASVKCDGEGRLEIDRRAIRKLEVNNQGLTRRCVLLLKDRSRHAFDYGEKPIDNVVAELRGAHRKRLDAKPDSKVKPIAGAVASATIYVVVFGLIGVIITFVFSVGGEEGVALYVLWAVLGMLCGFMSFLNGGEILTGEPIGDWTDRKDATRIGLVLLAIELFTLIALSILYTLFVTESLSLAFTFFVAVFLAALFGHASLRVHPKVISKIWPPLR